MATTTYSSEALWLDRGRVGETSDHRLNLNIGGSIPQRIIVHHPNYPDKDWIHKTTTWTLGCNFWIQVIIKVSGIHHGDNCGTTDNRFDNLEITFQPIFIPGGSDGSISGQRWYTDQEIKFYYYDTDNGEDYLVSLPSGWHYGVVTISKSGYTCPGWPNREFYIRAKNNNDNAPVRGYATWSITGSEYASSWCTMFSSSGVNFQITNNSYETGTKTVTPSSNTQNLNSTKTEAIY